MSTRITLLSKESSRNEDASYWPVSSPFGGARVAVAGLGCNFGTWVGVATAGTEVAVILELSAFPFPSKYYIIMVDIVCERTIRMLQEYVTSHKFKLPNRTD